MRNRGAVKSTREVKARAWPGAGRGRVAAHRTGDPSGKTHGDGRQSRGQDASVHVGHRQVGVTVGGRAERQRQRPTHLTRAESGLRLGDPHLIVEPLPIEAQTVDRHAGNGKMRPAGATRGFNGQRAEARCQVGIDVEATCEREGRTVVRGELRQRTQVRILEASLSRDAKRGKQAKGGLPAHRPLGQSTRQVGHANLSIMDIYCGIYIGQDGSVSAEARGGQFARALPGSGIGEGVGVYFTLYAAGELALRRDAAGQGRQRQGHTLATQLRGDRSQLRRQLDLGTAGQGSRLTH